MLSGTLGNLNSNHSGLALSGELEYTSNRLQVADVKPVPLSTPLPAWRRHRDVTGEHGISLLVVGEWLCYMKPLVQLYSDNEWGC